MKIDYATKVERLDGEKALHRSLGSLLGDAAGTRHGSAGARSRRDGQSIRVQARLGLDRRRTQNQYQSRRH